MVLIKFDAPHASVAKKPVTKPGPAHEGYDRPAKKRNKADDPRGDQTQDLTQETTPKGPAELAPVIFHNQPNFLLLIGFARLAEFRD